MDLTTLGPVLSHLTVAQFALALLIVAGADFLGGVVAAIKPPINYFSWHEATRVFETHGPKVVGIAAIAALSQALPAAAAGEVDVRAAVWSVAIGFLGAYFIQTYQSIRGSFDVAKQVAAEAGAAPGTLTSGPISESPPVADPGSELNGVPTDDGVTDMPPADGLGAEDGISGDLPGDLPGVPGS